jgi:hypothetical protein
MNAVLAKPIRMFWLLAKNGLDLGQTIAAALLLALPS